MVHLNSKMMETFIKLLEEEDSIKNYTIPTIYQLLVEATGYVEPNDDEPSGVVLSKKQKSIFRANNRKYKNSKMVTTESD